MKSSEVLNRITAHRRSQREFTRYLLARDELLGQKVHACGSWLHLREWIDSGESRLVNAKFCKKHLLCRCCAARRAGRLGEAYEPKVETVLATEPGLIPAMVTLTVKNGGDLVERIEHLKRSWSLMLAARRRGASASSRNKLVQWNHVAGSIRAMEITAGKDGSWHPHFHVFVLLRAYIDQAQLSSQWEEWTGDSKIVGVTKCRGGVRAGLSEVLKYVLAFADLSNEQTFEVHQACQGHRLFDAQGLLRGVPEPDIDSDSLEGLSGPYRDFLALWLWGEQKYDLRPYSALDIYDQEHCPELV